LKSNCFVLSFEWKILKTESIFIDVCFAVDYMYPLSINSLSFTKSYSPDWGIAKACIILTKRKYNEGVLEVINKLAQRSASNLNYAM
jgi:hypothetical protein